MIPELFKDPQRKEKTKTSHKHTKLVKWPDVYTRNGWEWWIKKTYIRWINMMIKRNKMLVKNNQKETFSSFDATEIFSVFAYWMKILNFWNQNLLAHLIAWSFLDSFNDCCCNQVLNQRYLLAERTFQRNVKLKGEHQASRRAQPLIARKFLFSLILFSDFNDQLTWLFPRPEAAVNSLGITANPWQYLTLFTIMLEFARAFE